MVKRMPDEECPEKIRLIENFREANKTYEFTIGELSAQRISESQYEKLNEAVDRARAAAFQARADLEQHVQEHQC